MQRPMFRMGGRRQTKLSKWNYILVKEIEKLKKRGELRGQKFEWY